jgi:hypothetical protein
MALKVCEEKKAKGPFAFFLAQAIGGRATSITQTVKEEQTGEGPE